MQAYLRVWLGVREMHDGGLGIVVPPLSRIPLVGKLHEVAFGSDIQCVLIQEFE